MLHACMANSALHMHTTSQTFPWMPRGVMTSHMCLHVQARRVSGVVLHGMRFVYPASQHTPVRGMCGEGYHGVRTRKKGTLKACYQAAGGSS